LSPHPAAPQNPENTRDYRGKIRPFLLTLCQEFWSQNLVVTALGNNQFLISGSGIADYTYRLQCSDTSGPFAWQDLVSKTADSTGKFQYTDATASQTRLYRTTYP
jgi:hypothetical protein